LNEDEVFENVGMIAGVKSVTITKHGRRQPAIFPAKMTIAVKTAIPSSKHASHSARSGGRYRKEDLQAKSACRARWTCVSRCCTVGRSRTLFSRLLGQFTLPLFFELLFLLSLFFQISLTFFERVIWFCQDNIPDRHLHRMKNYKKQEKVPDHSPPAEFTRSRKPGTAKKF
jgi:hypothetical protein